MYVYLRFLLSDFFVMLFWRYLEIGFDLCNINIYFFMFVVNIVFMNDLKYKMELKDL